MNKNKRPIWVWIIFLWFMFGGLSSFYTFYTLQTGTMEIPKGYEQPTGIFYFIEAYGIAILAMAAAIMLFLRKATNRWLFAALFVFSVLSTLYKVLFGAVLPLSTVTTILVIVGVLVIYALITRYSFKLLDTDYYK